MTMSEWMQTARLEVIAHIEAMKNSISEALKCTEDLRAEALTLFSQAQDLVLDASTEYEFEIALQVAGKVFLEYSDDLRHQLDETGRRQAERLMVALFPNPDKTKS
jgi:hypothetical protein